WQLPDLAYGAEAWALVRLHVPAAWVDGPGRREGVHLLRARARFVDLTGETAEATATDLRLEALNAAAFDAIAEDMLVKRRAIEVEVARLQRQAREASRRREWVEVDRL